jgi:hypothetical protein
MSDQQLLLLGLNALARAHAQDYFADGHRGAGLIAAYLLGRENNLDQRTRERIADLAERNWASTPLCAPFPDEKAEPVRIVEIGAALAAGGATLRQVGHNAIFAMLAVKGLRLLPSAATPPRIAGICRLIGAIQPWREDVPIDPTVDPPPFADGRACARYILCEAAAARDRFRRHGQGYTGHLLTFGQALVELAAMGEAVWAESCRGAFRRYLTLVRRGPEPGAALCPDHAPGSLRPTHAAYWEQRADDAVDIGHVFKYPHSYYALLRYADDVALAQAWDEQAYHLF